MRRRYLHAFAALAISGTAALAFAWDVEWAKLGATLLRAHVGWVALSAAMLLGEFGFRALRWKVLLRPLGRDARVRDLFAAQVIGAAANTLLPLRAGEIAKPLVAARRTGHPLAGVVATAVMERVYDLFGMISVLLLMVVVLPEGPSVGADQQHLVRNLKVYGGMFGLIAICCMVVFFVLATREQAARGVFAGIVRVAPGPVRDRLLSLFDGFVDGLGNARDARGLWQAGALSVFMWFNGALSIWVLFRAFDISLPFGAACFVGVAIALTVALPQAPGFIGVFQYAMSMTMGLWGLSGEVADGFAIMFWAVSFLPVTVVGLVAMWREGLSLGSFRSWRPPEPGIAPTPAGR